MSTGFHRTFNQEQYDLIKSQLIVHRLDPFIREIEASKGKNKGIIFPFARGLRFSALLIYSIRECLSDTNLEINWGQIIDDDGNMCSGECDIVIHKRGHIRRWDGHDGNHIMDFRFVNKKNALAVISCKSYLTKSNIETEYCQNMLKFIDRVWLFAECCGHESVEKIKKESKKIGYEFFWYLYKWSRTTENIIDDKEGWNTFINELRKLQ